MEATRSAREIQLDGCALTGDDVRAVVRGVAWTGAASWVTPRATKPAVVMAASRRLRDGVDTVRSRRDTLGPPGASPFSLNGKETDVMLIGP